MFLQSQFDSYASRLRDHDIPVRLRLWNGVEAQLGSATKVTITVPTLSALRHLLSPSLYVLGQAYVEGEIDVDGRATDIVDVAARLAAFESGASTRGRDGAQIISHTRKMDAEAIAYHYDVSNEFYSLWLDRNMVYSCGYFRTREDSLESAQTQKIDHILTKLRVQPGDRLLDIGCGWGALMIRAAEKFGAKVVGITLSNNQFEYARERIAAAGLANHCEVHIEDYRDVTGTFDRIASVGMFEHVGLKNLRSYFAKIRELLADNGAALNHGITLSDIDSRESPWGGSDFMDRYVFPHGELAHVSVTLRKMCSAGLEPMDVENLRRHYVLTLNHWATRFENAAARLRGIVEEKRYRIWRVYLAGCAYGFAHNWMALHQVLAVKAGVDALPLTRTYMYVGM